jgi:hypothetical protein
MIRALSIAAIVCLAGCSDDSGGNGSAEKVLDASSVEGGQKAVGIKPFEPDTVTTAVKLLQDVKVVLTKAAPDTLYVDVESKDPKTVAVVTATLKYSKWDEQQTTTIEGLQESTQDVEVVFTVRDTTETQTLKVKVLKVLPDAGPPPDTK